MPSSANRIEDKNKCHFPLTNRQLSLRVTQKESVQKTKQVKKTKNDRTCQRVILWESGSS